MSILATDTKTILCATENDGLIIVNDQGVVQKKYVNSKFNIRSLSSNSVWSLFLDKERRIWLGYYNKGLGVFDKINSKVSIIESLPGNLQSLQTNCVTGIAKDQQDQLWISMEGGGVDVYNTITKSFKHITKSDRSFYSGLTNDNITNVFIDKKQNIWLSSWNEGVFVLKTVFLSLLTSQEQSLYHKKARTFSRPGYFYFNSDMVHNDNLNRHYFNIDTTTPYQVMSYDELFR